MGGEIDFSPPFILVLSVAVLVSLALQGFVAVVDDITSVRAVAKPVGLSIILERLGVGIDVLVRDVVGEVQEDMRGLHAPQGIVILLVAP